MPTTYIYVFKWFKVSKKTGKTSEVCKKPVLQNKTGGCYIYIIIFDLSIKIRSTQGHHLNNCSSTGVSNATHQVPRPSVKWFCRGRFSNVSILYWGGGHIVHVTWTV